MSDSLDAKIIKQVEYYFSDVNIARDKFMKDTIAENDGWIPFETMLKFQRLKALSEDIEIIRNALSKSTSGLLEVGDKGIRRAPELTIPDSIDEVFEKLKDHCVYVKGFEAESTLDEIIEWLELHGGKTLNVHMRRFPDSKKFKGSIFAIFEQKEDAEKFLSSSEASKYKGNDTIRQYREDYMKGKKEEKEAKAKMRAAKNAATEASQRDHVSSRMVTGALLELSGLPKNTKANGSTEALKTEAEAEDDGVEKTSVEEDGSPNGLTVAALKLWLADRLGSEFPIAWIDVEPASGKALVRFKTANTAESAFHKLKSSFVDQPVVYANSELTGRVLTGEEEFSQWKTIVAAQQQKAQKRRGGRGGGRGGGGPNKRRRAN